MFIAPGHVHCGKRLNPTPQLFRTCKKPKGHWRNQGRQKGAVDPFNHLQGHPEEYVKSIEKLMERGVMLTCL